MYEINKSPRSEREKRLNKDTKAGRHSEIIQNSIVKSDDAPTIYQTKPQRKRETEREEERGETEQRNMKTCGNLHQEKDLTLEEFCEKFEIGLTISDHPTLKSEQFVNYFSAVKDQLEVVDRTSDEIYILQKQFESLNLRETWTEDLRKLDLLQTTVNTNTQNPTEIIETDPGLTNESRAEISAEIDRIELQFSPWPYRRKVCKELIDSEINVGGIFTDFICSHLSNFKEESDPLSPNPSPTVPAEKMATALKEPLVPGGEERKDNEERKKEDGEKKKGKKCRCVNGREGKPCQCPDMDLDDSVEEEFGDAINSIIQNTPNNVKKLRKDNAELGVKIKKMSEETVTNLVGLQQGLGTLARAHTSFQRHMHKIDAKVGQNSSDIRDMKRNLEDLQQTVAVIQKPAAIPENDQEISANFGTANLVAIAQDNWDGPITSSTMVEENNETENSVDSETSRDGVRTYSEAAGIQPTSILSLQMLAGGSDDDARQIKQLTNKFKGRPPPVAPSKANYWARTEDGIKWLENRLREKKMEDQLYVEFTKEDDSEGWTAEFPRDEAHLKVRNRMKDHARKIRVGRFTIPDYIRAERSITEISDQPLADHDYKFRNKVLWTMVDTFLRETMKMTSKPYDIIGNLQIIKIHPPTKKKYDAFPDELIVTFYNPRSVEIVMSYCRNLPQTPKEIKTKDKQDPVLRAWLDKDNAKNDKFCQRYFPSEMQDRVRQIHHQTWVIRTDKEEKFKDGTRPSTRIEIRSDFKDFIIMKTEKIGGRTEWVTRDLDPELVTIPFFNPEGWNRPRNNAASQLSKTVELMRNMGADMSEPRFGGIDVREKSKKRKQDDNLGGASKVVLEGDAQDSPRPSPVNSPARIPLNSGYTPASTPGSQTPDPDRSLYPGSAAPEDIVNSPDDFRLHYATYASDSVSGINSVNEKRDQGNCKYKNPKFCISNLNDPDMNIYEVLREYGDANSPVLDSPPAIDREITEHQQPTFDFDFDNLSPNHSVVTSPIVESPGADLPPQHTQNSQSPLSQPHQYRSAESLQISILTENSNLNLSMNDSNQFSNPQEPAHSVSPPASETTPQNTSNFLTTDQDHPTPPRPQQNVLTSVPSHGPGDCNFFELKIKTNVVRTCVVTEISDSVYNSVVLKILRDVFYSMKPGKIVNFWGLEVVKQGQTSLQGKMALKIKKQGAKNTMNLTVKATLDQISFTSKLGNKTPYGQLNIFMTRFVLNKIEHHLQGKQYLFKFKYDTSDTCRDCLADRDNLDHRCNLCRRSSCRQCITTDGGVCIKPFCENFSFISYKNRHRQQHGIETITTQNSFLLDLKTTLTNIFNEYNTAILTPGQLNNFRDDCPPATPPTQQPSILQHPPTPTPGPSTHSNPTPTRPDSPTPSPTSTPLTTGTTLPTTSLQSHNTTRTLNVKDLKTRFENKIREQLTPHTTHNSRKRLFSAPANHRSPVTQNTSIPHTPLHQTSKDDVTPQQPAFNTPHQNSQPPLTQFKSPQQNTRQAEQRPNTQVDDDEDDNKIMKEICANLFTEEPPKGNFNKKTLSSMDMKNFTTVYNSKIPTIVEPKNPLEIEGKIAIFEKPSDITPAILSSLTKNQLLQSVKVIMAIKEEAHGILKDQVNVSTSLVRKLNSGYETLQQELDDMTKKYNDLRRRPETTVGGRLATDTETTTKTKGLTEIAQLFTATKNIRGESLDIDTENLLSKSISDNEALQANLVTLRNRLSTIAQTRSYLKHKTTNPIFQEEEEEIQL